LPQLIQYTKGVLPTAQIMLFTNGDLLTLEKYIQLSDCGVDVFRVSQHSLNPQRNVLDVVSYAKEINGKPVSIANYYAEFYNNDNANNMLGNRGGLVAGISEKQKSFCFYVNQMTFDYKGNAVLCCNDYQSSTVFGNITDKSVKDIWLSQDYVAARRKIMGGEWMYDICRKCNSKC
jgi:GTP 3',8-cyclase